MKRKIMAIAFGFMCLLAIGTGVKADYYLETVLLTAPQYRQLGYERFISYFDCRERGLSNLALLQNAHVRGGFTCTYKSQ